MSTGVPREKAVFCQALEISDPEQRRLFLDQACGTDKALLQRVEGLLALSPSAGDFFKECVPALEASAADAERVLPAAESALTSELPDSKRIGPYKLLQKLGEGGYGVVYMAEQEQPIRRRVALKIIKLGMDTRNVIARFEAERQALALMDHPNIARVLDAGATSSGRPYFVMELVYGVKITDYCDQNRVSMRERLELFIQVCNAVQHAHQKGIIHRDLKPSNIMVTMHDGVPVPKVIDFGIAKATEQRLTDKTLFTSYAQLMGTPAYMSPEQMELSGLNLDTRSDIYSLGVLLYELLTGRTPFDTADLLKGGVEELRRTLCERDPLSPSAKLQTLKNEELTKTARKLQVEAPRLLSQLRGDLDWIVLRCLEKDRTRRYATANALAIDIGHYLHEEAVEARPPSQFYRLQKLVRKNRMVFLFGAAAVAALLLGTIVSTLLFLSEARLRREAESRAKASHVAQLVTQRRLEEADKLLAEVPLRPSLEVAAELRALGDWYAAHRAWRQAADRFRSLVVADQLDDPEVISIDQLKFAASLLEAGNRLEYEQFRKRLIATFLPAQSSLPLSALKACLLLPLDPDLLRSVSSVLGSAANGNGSSLEKPSAARYAIQWSDAMALLEYRRGNYSNTVYQPYRLGNPAEFATSCFIEFANRWQLKDYWGAMLELTRGYELFQVGANPRPVGGGRGGEIFPGLAEFIHVEGSWYDWAVGDLLLREFSEMIIQAERRVSRIPGRTPTLEELAITRAGGEWHALNGDWTNSLLCSQFCVASSQLDTVDHATTDYFNAALASLKLDDQNGYSRLRQEMISKFKDTDQPTRILHIALLAPIDERTALKLEPFAAAVTRDMRGRDANPLDPVVLGLLEYRRGKYTNAIDLARHGVSPIREALPNAMASVVSGLCLDQLGNRLTAHSELDRAKGLIQTGFDFDYDMWWWRQWASLRLLLAEAETAPSRLTQPSSAPAGQ